MDRTEHLRLRSDLAALRFQLALIRLEGTERKYRSDQPRVPAGSPEGGEWTGGDTGFATSAGDAPLLDDGVFRPAENGTPSAEPSAATKPPPVDLRKEELQGGHAIDHGHVGVPNGALVQRLEGERLDLPAVSIVAAAHGSFNDISTANAYTNDVLQSSPDRVADVASGSKRTDFLEKRYTSPTGREAYRMTDTDKSAIAVRPTFSVGVSIKHTGTGKGFVVTTAFPKN